MLTAGPIHGKRAGQVARTREVDGVGRALTCRTAVNVSVATVQTTQVTTTLGSAVSGFYVGKTFIALTGSNAKQGGRLVTAYDGATRRLTLDLALTAPMSVLDTFVLVG